MHLTLAHSPDSDDGFMFCALAKDKIPTGGLTFEHIREDIESLNRRAEKQEMDITALSAHAYAFLTDRYILLNSGASMGQGYGPRIITRHNVQEKKKISRLRIAIPGEKTSAFLAARLALGDFEYGCVPFNQILSAVSSGQFDAGLIIHEGQLTFQDDGLYLALDLGQNWEEETGLPLPLGVNAIRRDLDRDVQMQVDRVLRASVEWALENRQEALDYAAEFARGLDRDRMDRFVAMYVNERTLEYDRSARKGLDLFFEKAREKGLIPAEAKPQFVERAT